MGFCLNFRLFLARKIFSIFRQCGTQVRQTNLGINKATVCLTGNALIFIGTFAKNLLATFWSSRGLVMGTLSVWLSTIGFHLRFSRESRHQKSYSSVKTHNSITAGTHRPLEAVKTILAIPFDLSVRTAFGYWITACFRTWCSRQHLIDSARQSLLFINYKLIRLYRNKIIYIRWISSPNRTLSTTASPVRS